MTTTLCGGHIYTADRYNGNTQYKKENGLTQLFLLLEQGD